jgi:hypothetical protein
VVFQRFWMGRRVLAGYEEARRRGETRVCFLKITLDPVIRSYAVGYRAWELRRHMESAAATVRIPGLPGKQLALPHGEEMDEGDGDMHL